MKDKFVSIKEVCKNHVIFKGKEVCLLDAHDMRIGAEERKVKSDCPSRGLKSGCKKGLYSR